MERSWKKRKRGKVAEVLFVPTKKKDPSALVPLALPRGFTPCRVSLDTKAGKFDIVFDNNVRKLEEIQPVVQGIKAKLSGHEFQQLLAFSFGCVVWWMAGKGWMPAIHHDEQCRCVWTYWSLDLKRQVCATWWFCLEWFDCDSFFSNQLVHELSYIVNVGTIHRSKDLIKSEMHVAVHAVIIWIM